MLDDGQGARHLVEVVQGLAHAHENDIGRLLPSTLHRPVELFDHLAGSQVAGEPQGRGRAKGAAPGTANLAGDAQGEFAALLLVVGDQHGLDSAAVVGKETKLPRAVHRLNRFVQDQRHKRRIGQAERRAKPRGTVDGASGNAHAAHASRARTVQPAKDLLGAKWTARPRAQRAREVHKGE
jgi:hypothetical protein